MARVKAEQAEIPRVKIFVDGACSGNPGPGGWAAIIRTTDNERERSGGHRR